MDAIKAIRTLTDEGTLLTLQTEDGVTNAITAHRHFVAVWIVSPEGDITLESAKMMDSDSGKLRLSTLKATALDFLSQVKSERKS